MIRKSLFRKPALRLEGQEQKAEKKVQVLECPACRNKQELSELEGSLMLCSRCGHHYKMTARQRIACLLDEGSFKEISARIVSRDPLQFPGYQDKLTQAREPAASGRPWSLAWAGWRACVAGSLSWSRGS